MNPYTQISRTPGSQWLLAALLVVSGSLPGFPPQMADSAPLAGSNVATDTGETGRTYRSAREYALDGSWSEAGRSPSCSRLAEAVASPPAEPPVTLADLLPTVKPQLMVWGYEDAGHFNLPRGIAFDPKDGSIVVANSGDHRIAFFSSTGRPLLQVVHRVTRPDGKEADGIPGSLAFDGSGQLLVVDSYANYVDVIDRRGRSLDRLVIPAGRPSCVTTSRSGAIYVGTSGATSTIYRFNPDHSPAGSWGQTGLEPGQLTDVTAIAELPEGNIAVGSARGKFGIQIFTPDGAYVRGFGIHDLAPGNLSLPTGIVGSADGRIWVSDEIRQTIEVFTADGAYIAPVSGSGDPFGDFSYPSSLATDGKGLIAVTERGSGRFQVMSISKHEEVSAGEKL